MESGILIFYNYADYFTPSKLYVESSSQLQETDQVYFESLCLL